MEGNCEEDEKKMLTLSEEQLRKIEENRAAAILKKQQAILKLKNAATNNNPGRPEVKTNSEGVNKYEKTSKISNSCNPPLITATCRVFGESRFIIDMPYHEESIELFKTINGRKYESDQKKWSFPLSEQSEVLTKLQNISSRIVVSGIPDSVVKVLLESEPRDSGFVQWSKIDKTLRDYLMPFQVEGIKFGVRKKGRCLIADDMGLGKTIQALGIAHYFKENWPLLIVCPSSMKFPWQEAIKKFLPSVEVNVQVVVSGKNQTVEGDIVISSYDLMKNLYEDLQRRRFRAIIFDESHLLKSSKSIRTKIALELASTARNVILLSGTPALSRPQELFCQISIIDPLAFRSFYDYGMRYCDGKKDRFGWNFSGSSNLEELELYLKKKLMIRRLKSEVIKQLPSKIRKIVFLNPNVIKTISRQMQRLESVYNSAKGAEKHSTLLAFYGVTGSAKLNAICEYLTDKLESDNKFLVFAHHVEVMDGICELMSKKKVDYIRIDGSVSSESRKDLCDKFQNLDECRVAVLSIKAANCGITLTAAQLVIFAELYWNPGELIQAEDRAHRIGQQDSVLVEYLVAKNTADDYLWKLIEKKLNVLNQVGLSKDSFKDTNTEHLDDPRQTKLTPFLTGKAPETEIPKIDDDEFAIPEAEDDIFSNINLEEIESEYQMNNKKRKTSEGV